MATIRVHEDQENRVIADIRRQGKENASVPLQNQNQQQKRAVLGVLQNNCPRASKPVSIFSLSLALAYYLKAFSFIDKILPSRTLMIIFPLIYPACL